MQPTEAVTTPRRSLDVEDYIDIVRRHKGWIFGPFLFTLVASVVGAYMWPDSYTSTAIIRVVPQQVPEQMVPAAVSQQVDQKINSMLQTVESRASLSNIINSFNLYPKLRAQEPLEDVIEQMKKKDLSIAQVQSIGGAQSDQRRTMPAFSISFSYENRYFAQKVAQDIAGKLLDESQHSQSNATFASTNFLKQERDQAKKELDEVEGRLQAFQTENNGRLPDQLDANMRELSTLQIQMSNISNQISRDNQDRLQITAMISTLKDQMAAIAKDQPVEQITQAAKQKNDKLEAAENDVRRLQISLDVLLQKYKEDWPEVKQVRGQLVVAKQVRDELLKEDTTAKAADSAATAATPKAAALQSPQQIKDLRDLDGRIRNFQANIEAKDLEISNLNKEMSHLNDQTKVYMGRVETLPAGVRQYGDLVRDRDLAKAKYVKLDEDLQRAQIASDMDNQKQGESLELLDPASLPLNQTAPNRPLIILVGAAVGLILGLIIAGAMEMKDTSLKNLKDVRAYTQLAILGSIPLLENDFVVRRRKRLAWLGWTTASLVAVVIMSGSVVYYYVTKV